MKKSITAILLFLTFSSCTQEKNCSDFKTGKFAYVDKNQPEKVIRTENVQIETNYETGVKIISSIEWMSECVYIMTYQEIQNFPGDVTDFIGKEISVEIIETKGNRFWVNAKSDTMDEKIEFIKRD